MNYFHVENGIINDNSNKKLPAGSMKHSSTSICKCFFRVLFNPMKTAWYILYQTALRRASFSKCNGDVAPRTNLCLRAGMEIRAFTWQIQVTKNIFVIKQWNIIKETSIIVFLAQRTPIC